MSFQHKKLAAGHWQNLSFIEQMANIGSEIERAIFWRKKKNKDYSRKALERAIELLFLTIADSKNKDRLKELTRLHEAIVDYFFDKNTFSSSDELWHKYFYPFNYAARLIYFKM